MNLYGTLNVCKERGMSHVYLMKMSGIAGAHTFVFCNATDNGWWKKNETRNRRGYKFMKINWLVGEKCAFWSVRDIVGLRMWARSAHLDRRHTASTLTSFTYVHTQTFYLSYTNFSENFLNFIFSTFFNMIKMTTTMLMTSVQLR